MSAATVAFLAKYNHRTGGVKRSQGHDVLHAAVHRRRARGCERSAASRAPNQASGAPRSGACCGRAGGHRASRAVGIASSYIKRSPERLWPALVPVGVHAPTLLSWKRSELRAFTVLKTSPSPRPTAVTAVTVTHEVRHPCYRILYASRLSPARRT